MWIIIIIGILIVIGLFSVADSNKEARESEQLSRKAEELAAKKKQRSAAYADYLRRTQPKIQGGKTNNELNDEISTAIDRFAKASDEADKAAGMILIIGIGISIYVGIHDGEWISFFIFGGISLVCAGWYESSAKRKIRKDFLSKGWEPDRLKL